MGVFLPPPVAGKRRKKPLPGQGLNQDCLMVMTQESFSMKSGAVITALLWLRVPARMILLENKIISQQNSFLIFYYHLW